MTKLLIIILVLTSVSGYSQNSSLRNKINLASDKAEPKVIAWRRIFTNTRSLATTKQEQRL